MGEILKFPGEATKLWLQPCAQTRPAGETISNQLDLFLPAAVRISSISSASVFERALMCDERGEVQAADLYAQGH